MRSIWIVIRCHNTSKVLQSIENYVCLTVFFYIVVKGRMIFIVGLAMVTVMIMRFATLYHLIIAILLHQFNRPSTPWAHSLASLVELRLRVGPRTLNEKKNLGNKG